MPFKHKYQRLKSRYGMPKGQFEELALAQNNKCAGCGKEVPLCVDHDHETGKIRGLLCRTCNACIGLAQEKLSILKNLVSYLEK